MNIERVQGSIYDNVHIAGHEQEKGELDECRYMPASRKQQGWAPELGNVEIPNLGFDDAGNVFAYLYTRLIMQVGTRAAQRIRPRRR